MGKALRARSIKPFARPLATFFVVRTKENILLQRRYSHPVDKTTGLRSNHTVIFTAIDSAKAYPDPQRRVTYFDAENQRGLKSNGSSSTCESKRFTVPARMP